MQPPPPGGPAGGKRVAGGEAAGLSRTGTAEDRSRTCPQRGTGDDLEFAKLRHLLQVLMTQTAAGDEKAYRVAVDYVFRKWIEIVETRTTPRGWDAAVAWAEKQAGAVALFAAKAASKSPQWVADKMAAAWSNFGAMSAQREDAVVEALAKYLRIVLDVFGKNLGQQQNSRTLRAATVALACDAVIEHFLVSLDHEVCVLQTNRSKYISWRKEFHRFRMEMMARVAGVLHEQSQARNIPESTWQAVAAFGRQLGEAHRFLRNHVLKACHGGNPVFKSVLPAGCGGAHIIRCLAELEACIRCAGKELKPLKWSTVMTAHFPDWRFDILLHCVLEPFGSHYCPYKVTPAGFQDLFRGLTECLTARRVCDLVRRHPGCFADFFDNELARLVTDQCWGHSKQDGGQAGGQAPPSHLDFVDFCRHVAFPLFPHEDGAKDYPVQKQLGALLTAQNEEGIRGLSQACEDRKTAQRINEAANKHIRSVTLERSNQDIVARVLHGLASSGAVDLNEYIAEKQEVPRHDPGLLIGLIGGVLSIPSATVPTGRLLDVEKVLKFLRKAARVCATSNDWDVSLALLGLLSEAAALRWTPTAAERLRLGVRDFLKESQCFAMHPYHVRMRAKQFLLSNVRADLPPEGTGLFDLAWELLAERMVTSGSSSEGRSAVLVHGHSPDIPVTDHPVFRNVKVLDQWMFTESLQDLVESGTDAQGRAAAALLRAYYRFTGMPFCQPRRFPLPPEYRPFRCHPDLEESYKQFEEHVELSARCLKDAIRGNDISMDQTADLEQLPEAHRVELGFDAKVFRQRFQSVKDRMQLLDFVLCSFEQDWKVRGLEDYRHKLEAARSEEKIATGTLSSFLFLVDEGEKLLPQKYSPAQLEQAAGSALFMSHYEHQLHQLPAQELRDGRLDISTFKRVLDKVLGKEGTLRALAHSTTVADALKALPVDGRATPEDYEGLVPLANREAEKAFLRSDAVGCSTDIVESLTDCAIPLVEFTFHLRHFRDWEAGRVASSLQLRDGFFRSGAVQKLLRRTVEEVGMLPLSSAAAELRQLREVTRNCSPQALRLIGCVLRCPRLVSFVQRLPETLAAHISQALTTSRDQRLAMFHQYSWVVEYVLVILPALQTFESKGFANIKGRNPIEASSCESLFEGLSNLLGLDQALTADERESKLRYIAHSMHQTAEKKVLDQLERGIDALMGGKQALLRNCNAHRTALIEIYMPVTGQPELRCDLRRGSDDEDTEGEVWDLAAYKGAVTRAQMMADDDEETLQEFVRVAKFFIEVYKMACTLSGEGHIVFRGRTMFFQVDLNEGDVPQIITVMQQLCSSWSSLLDEEVQGSPPLSILSAAQQVRMARLLQTEPAKAGASLREGWHIAAGMGAPVSRDRLLEILGELNRGGHARLQMDPDAFQCPEMFKEQVQENSRSLLKDVSRFSRELLDAAGRGAHTGGIDSVRCVLNFDGDGGARLKDISQIAANDRRPYALSWFRTAELCTQDWLECSSDTTLEQVRTFCRRFAVLVSGRMGVLHFQELRTELQNMLRGTPPNTAEKQLLLFITVDKGGLCSRAERIAPLSEERTREVHSRVVEMRRFASVTCFGGVSGTGKSTTIEHRIAASQIDPQHVVRIHIHAATSITHICGKLLASVPWGTAKDEPQEKWALVIDVAHDADPATVNTVLDELVLFGTMSSPSGLCCSAAAWSRWNVYIELQEASERWEERINLLRVDGLVADGQPLLMPFKLDLADPTTGQLQHPGAADSIRFIREYYVPKGGWQRHSDVGALQQLVRSRCPDSVRNLARAAKFLAKRVPELRECPFFKFSAENTGYRSQRAIGKMLAGCTVHGLHQHLKPDGEDHVHMCAAGGSLNCMLFSGSMPADIALDAAASAIPVTEARQGAGGRSMPLYKLVDMLSAVTGVKPQIITKSLLANDYILITDFLSKMVQQSQRADLGDLCILRGPSGTGKTACTLQTAALEPQSGNHPHNNLSRKLAEFFFRSEELKQHCPAGSPPAAMDAEDVAEAGIPGVGTAEQDEGRAELASTGQLSDFLNTVLNRNDWAVLYHVLDGLAELAARGEGHEQSEEVGTAPAELPPAATAPGDAAAAGTGGGELAAEDRGPGSEKKRSVRIPTVSPVKAIDQIRSALWHVLDPQIKSDPELELAMAKSLPGACSKLKEKLEAVGEDRERRARLYLDKFRPQMQLLHPDSCLTAADPEAISNCVAAIKAITGCLGSGKTTFISAAVRAVLTGRMSEVLSAIRDPVAETLRKTLQTDQVDHALHWLGTKALERMGDAAQEGVAIIAQWMENTIKEAPLANPTDRFLELTRDAVPAASLPELLCEFVKTGAHDNHKVVLMRFDMEESELYEQLKPLLERAQRSAELAPDSPLRFVVFIDEANTSKSTGLLKHIMLDRRWEMWPGGKLPSNISFVAAINPCKRDEDPGGDEDPVSSSSPDSDGDAGDGPGAEHLHDVNPIPPSLDHAIVPWQQLEGPGRDEFVTTKLYTNATVFNSQFSAAVIKGLKDIVLTAHDFVHRLYRRRPKARSTVSQRDIHRTFTFFNWFFHRPDACTRDAKGNTTIKARDAMIVATAVSYYFRLRPADRTRLANRVDRVMEKSGAFEVQRLEEILTYVVDQYFREMTRDELPEGIFQHQPLRENLFVQLVCFENRLPVVLHGPPGTSKTLSSNIVKDAMSAMSNQFTAQFHQVCEVVRYQGSRQSAAADIRKKCEECEANQRRHDDAGERKLSLLNIDEAGIVHSGDPRVLKVLHYFLGEAGLAAVLMTNDPLDPAVSNRCVEVRLTEPTSDELEDIACGIIQVNGVATLEETKRVIKGLSRAYHKLRFHGKLAGGFKRWYGLRDFYHLVRFLRRNGDRDGKVQPRSPKSQKCAARVTPRLLLQGLERNFNGNSGKKDSSNLQEAVMETVQRECSSLQWRAFNQHPDVLLDPRRRRNVVEVVADSLADNNRARGDSQSNMSDMWVRFKLLVDETPDGSLLSLLQACGLPEFRNIKVISLSELSKDEFHAVGVVREISAAMEAGITVWLTNTREIDGSLYDLFNQSYTVCNGQDGQALSFVPLAVGGVVENKRVHENFQIIVHVMRSEVPLLPPPFLNRLEKFPIGTADVLAYRMGQIKRQGELTAAAAARPAEVEAARQHSAEQLTEIKWLRKRCHDIVDAISYSAPTVASDTLYSKDVASTIDSIVLGCIEISPDGVHSLRDAPDSSALRSLLAHGVKVAADAPSKEAAQRRMLSCALQLLELCRPEGVLLAKEQLARAPAFWHAYFKDMAPCSCRGFVSRLLQDCAKAGPDSWVCCMMHVPNNADVLAVLEGLSQERPELSVMPFDMIASREHFEGAITTFAQDGRRRAFAVAVGGASDVAIREMLQLMSTRPEGCSGRKTVLLVRPFRPELFRSSFAPLPGGSWRHVYADASPDIAGAALASYAAVEEDEAGVSDAQFYQALENALRGAPMPTEDRLPVGNDAFTGAAAQMYSPQCTGRPGFCRDLFTKFPRAKGALLQSFQRITCSEERYNYAQRQALLALCDQAPRSLAEQLQDDRCQNLQKVCYLVIRTLLEDCNAAVLIKLRPAERPQVDGMLEQLILSALHGVTADKLRQMNTLDLPITASGVLPYLPGFRSLRRLLALDSSLDPERAANTLRSEWEERRIADPAGREAIAIVERSKLLFELFEKDCVRQCVHCIAPGTQNTIVDVTLELMRAVHAEIFGADAERTVWSVLAVSSCRAHIFESYALGLLPLAESNALSAESVTRLRRAISGKPQAELGVELANWVQELVTKRFDEVSHPDEVRKWSLSVQRLFHGVAEEGIATPLITAAALSVAAKAVHAENTPELLHAARDFVKHCPQDGSINHRGLQLLHEQSPAAAQAAVLHLAQMGRLGGRADFRDAALRQCAESRVSRAMTARVLVDSGLLPDRGQSVAQPEALQTLWRLAGGTDDSEVPSCFPAEGPLSSTLYRALGDILYERLTDPADATNTTEYIANRHQRAVGELEEARQQDRAAEAGWHSVEVHATGQAYIKALGYGFLQDPASLPCQGQSTEEELQTAKSLLASEENREEFLAAVRRASEETGGARLFLARFCSPDAKARLHSLSEEMDAICSGAKELPRYPNEWKFQDAVAPHAAELSQAVDAAAQEADAGAAAQLLSAAVAEAVPAGVGVARALLALQSRTSRAKGRPLPAALASDAALAAALELDPDAQPGVQPVLAWCFVGASAAEEECGVVDIARQPGVDDWLVAAESLLSMALAQQPGTMLHSMLCDQSELRGTIVPYGDSGQLEVPEEMATGACNLLEFVEGALMVFGALLNPPAQPNSPQDVLWQDVFPCAADRSSGNVDGHSERRIFLDSILERSRNDFVRLVDMHGLGVDCTGRIVALFCERLVHGHPQLAPLQQRIDSADKVRAAETAVQAFWKEATANNLSLLRLPTDGLGCDTLRLANEVVERRKGDHLPEQRAAEGAFYADQAACNACPVLCVMHKWGQALQWLPRLLVLGMRLYDWVHTHLSGSVKEKDYARPLRAFTAEFDKHGGASGGVSKLLADFVDALNTSQGPNSGFDIKAEKLDAHQVQLAYFIRLPPDTVVGDRKHTNEFVNLLQKLVQEYNEWICIMADEDEEDYERSHARLHPRVLSPGRQQSLVLRGISELPYLCRSYSRGPGDWDWQQADREVRRQVGEDLPLFRLPDPGDFRWCSELGEAASTECARGLRSALARNQLQCLRKPIPEREERQLRRRTHQLGCADITALAAAVRKLFTDSQIKMLATSRLRDHLDKALEKAGVQGEMRAQLSDAVDGLEVAHLRALAELLAGKLECLAWKHADLPFEMAMPLPAQLYEQIQQRLRNSMERPDQRADPLEPLLEFEEVMSNCLQQLRGIINDPRIADMQFTKWLTETMGAELQIGEALEGTQCKHFVELLRLLQRQRAEAEKASRGNRHRVEWREDGGDAPGDRAEEEDDGEPEWHDCAPDDDDAMPDQFGSEATLLDPAEIHLKVDDVLGNVHAAVPASTLHPFEPDDPIHRHYTRDWNVVPYWLDGVGDVVYHHPEARELFYFYKPGDRDLPLTVADAMRCSEIVSKARLHLKRHSLVLLHNGDTAAAERELREARLPADLHGLVLALHEATRLLALGQRGEAGGAEWHSALKQLTRLRDVYPEVHSCTAAAAWPCPPEELFEHLHAAVTAAAERCAVPTPAGLPSHSPVGELMQFIEEFLSCEMELQQLTAPAPAPSPPPSEHPVQDHADAASAGRGSVSPEDTATLTSRLSESRAPSSCAPAAAPAPPPAPRKLPANEPGNFDEVFTWLQDEVKLPGLKERKEEVMAALHEEGWDGAEVADLAEDTIDELLGVIGLRPTGPNRRKLARFICGR